MKVIIAGGRDFTNYEILKYSADEKLSGITEDIEIVCGGAKGADELGKWYATEKGYKLKEFPADWAKHGKAAGPLRNEEMAKYADALIAFWDGKSKGTQDMIKRAESKNLLVQIVLYNQ
jgi:hypothetical protein